MNPQKVYHSCRNAKRNPPKEMKHFFLMEDDADTSSSFHASFYLQPQSPGSEETSQLPRPLTFTPTALPITSFALPIASSPALPMASSPALPIASSPALPIASSSSATQEHHDHDQLDDDELNDDGSDETLFDEKLLLFCTGGGSEEICC